MYLTKDEFLIIQAFKQGEGWPFIEKTYGMKHYFNDPRIEALCWKYGTDTSSYRKNLSEKADLNKIEVIDADKMPYYDYDFDNNMILVKRIPVSKKDIIQLLKVFEKPEFNDTDCYYLQYNDESLGFGLDLIDSSGKKHHVRSWIDGRYYIGDDLVEEES